MTNIIKLIFIIFSVFYLQGCNTFTRDLWEPDHPNGVEYCTVPISFVDIKSLEGMSTLCVTSNESYKIKYRYDGNYLIPKTIKKNEPLVFKINNENINGALKSAAIIPGLQISSININLDCEREPFTANFKANIQTEFNNIMSRCENEGPLGDFSTCDNEKLASLIKIGLRSLFSSTNYKHYKPVGWVDPDGNLKYNFKDLGNAFVDWPQSEALNRIDKIAIIVTAVSNENKSLRWNVSLNVLVKIGYLISLRNDKWIYIGDDNSAFSNDIFTTALSSNYKMNLSMNILKQVPRYDFWHLVGRISLTPFAVTGDAVAISAAVVTSPVWLPFALYFANNWTLG